MKIPFFSSSQFKILDNSDDMDLVIERKKINNNTIWKLIKYALFKDDLTFIDRNKKIIQSEHACRVFSQQPDKKLSKTLYFVCTKYKNSASDKLNNFVNLCKKSKIDISKIKADRSLIDIWGYHTYMMRHELRYHRTEEEKEFIRFLYNNFSIQDETLKYLIYNCLGVSYYGHYVHSDADGLDLIKNLNLNLFNRIVEKKSVYNIKKK